VDIPEVTKKYDPKVNGVLHGENLQEPAGDELSEFFPLASIF